MKLSYIEICAGGGGQAIGIEKAGFEAEALVELDTSSCATLRLNRPHWNVIEGDVREFSAKPYKGVRLKRLKGQRLKGQTNRADK